MTNNGLTDDERRKLIQESIAKRLAENQARLAAMTPEQREKLKRRKITGCFGRVPEKS